jgi:hypothetical protein
VQAHPARRKDKMVFAGLKDGDLTAVDWRTLEDVEAAF